MEIQVAVFWDVTPCRRRHHDPSKRQYPTISLHVGVSRSLRIESI